jgi:hypothetical protein
MTVPVAAFQHAFLRAVLGGDASALRPFLAENASTGTESVYRNNIYRSAMGSLERAYPAVRKILGSSCFAELARSYFLLHPPRERTLVGYGLAFPDHLSAAPSSPSYAFIKDVARLDRAWLEAHMAPDEDCAIPDDLIALEEHALAATCLELHASALMVHLEWGVIDAWSDSRLRSQEPALLLRDIQKVSGAALLWRHNHEVRCIPLEDADWTFLQTLHQGQTLGTAAARALEEDEKFNLADRFARYLNDGVFARTVSGCSSQGGQ